MRLTPRVSRISVERGGARDYDPTVGRWISEDPIGLVPAPKPGAWWFDDRGTESAVSNTCHRPNRARICGAGLSGFPDCRGGDGSTVSHAEIGRRWHDGAGWYGTARNQSAIRSSCADRIRSTSSSAAARACASSRSAGPFSKPARAGLARQDRAPKHGAARPLHPRGRGSSRAHRIRGRARHGRRTEGENQYSMRIDSSPLRALTEGTSHRRQGRRLGAPSFTLAVVSRGVPARGRLVEAVGATRNRAQAKRRKAYVPWVSRSPAAKPEVCWSVGCIGDGIRVKFCVSYPGRSAGLRAMSTVAAEDERTRR